MTGSIAEVLARVDLVAVEAGRRSAEIEAARSLPRDLVEALLESGVFRLAVPVDLGGLGADLATLLRAVDACAHRDGSTGWCVMSYLLAASDAARLPRHHATSVVGDARSIVAGHRGWPGRPGGTARLTEDGGLVVTGRWSWGSGVANSSWIGAGARIVDDDGRPTGGPGDQAEVHALFRRDQVVVLDTWHALGLRGTGSTDFQVTEAFVPEGRWLPADTDTAVADRAATDIGASEASGRIGPNDLLAAGASAVAIAIATRAIDEVVAVGPTTDGWPPALAERPAARTDLARVGAVVAAARCHLDRAVAVVDGTVAGSAAAEPGTDLVSAALHAVEQAVAAVDRCHHLGGPGAVLHASPLQRLLRDVHVVAQHPVVSPVRWEAIGRRRFHQTP